MKNKDYKQSYRWENKKDPDRRSTRGDWFKSEIVVDQAHKSLKRLTYNKFQLTIEFVYNEKFNTINTPSTLSDDKLLWTQTIVYYVKRKDKRKIDWLLTGRSFESIINGQFKLETTLVYYITEYKSECVASFENIIRVDGSVYKNFLRQLKLKRILK